MYKIKLLVLTLCAVVLLVGCATSTPVPTAISVADPVTIMQNFLDAVNAKDADKAKSFLADNVQCTGPCQFSGKDLMYITMANLVGNGSTLKMKDVKPISEDTVSLVIDILDVNGNSIGVGTRLGKAQVKDGKIILIDPGWE